MAPGSTENVISLPDAEMLPDSGFGAEVSQVIVVPVVATSGAHAAVAGRPGNEPTAARAPSTVANAVPVAGNFGFAAIVGHPCESNRGNQPVMDSRQGNAFP